MKDIKPPKTIYDRTKQLIIRNKLLTLFKSIFDSDERIKQIRIYGSALKLSLGVYSYKYMPNAPTARDRSDIDTVILFKGLTGNKIRLKNGILLEKWRFIKDGNNNIIYIEGHPVMCAPLTTPEDFRIKRFIPWAFGGYNYTLNSKVLFKRK